MDLVPFGGMGDALAQGPSPSLFFVLCCLSWGMPLVFFVSAAWLFCLINHFFEKKNDLKLTFEASFVYAFNTSSQRTQL